MPTTLIGLIDASVSIKVAVNHGKSKNRLGAYHASQKVILDFSFLRTLPIDQVRNGMAELIKISTVANSGIFELLEKYGEDLLDTRFGHLDGTPELREIADRVTYDAINTMLDSRCPTCRRSTWTGSSPSATPGARCWNSPRTVPFFHGHAINIDMALSTTLAEQRGYISVSERDRIFCLMSGLGLALDSPHLTPELLRTATEAILQTRDGLLRAAVPRPIGTCYFINDLTVGRARPSAGHPPRGVPQLSARTAPARTCSSHDDGRSTRAVGAHRPATGDPDEHPGQQARSAASQRSTRWTASTRRSGPTCARPASWPAGWTPT